MVLVGNEDEETTCEAEDRANANGKLHPSIYFNIYSRETIECELLNSLI